MSPAASESSGGREGELMEEPGVAGATVDERWEAGDCDEDSGHGDVPALPCPASALRFSSGGEPADILSEAGVAGETGDEGPAPGSIGSDIGVD